jgi:hypothetical protein
LLIEDVDAEGLGGRGPRQEQKNPDVYV